VSGVFEPNIPNDRLSKPPDQGSSAFLNSSRSFLKKLFQSAPHFEQCFREICNSGCPEEEFGPLLYATCLLITFRNVPLLDAANLTKAQLRGLPKRLRSIAQTIKLLNATLLAPATEMKIMPNAPKGSRAQAARDYLVLRYETLPNMLNVYALHLERFTRISRQMLKRLTTGQLYALRVVHCVKKYTKRPRYEAVAELLTQGCSIVAGPDSVPDFLTAEALTKLYQRWREALN
jgi:hypothetical protein